MLMDYWPSETVDVRGASVYNTDTAWFPRAQDVTQKYRVMSLVYKGRATADKFQRNHEASMGVRGREEIKYESWMKLPAARILEIGVRRPFRLLHQLISKVPPQ